MVGIHAQCSFCHNLLLTDKNELAKTSTKSSSTFTPIPTVSYTFTPAPALSGNTYTNVDLLKATKLALKSLVQSQAYA